MARRASTIATIKAPRGMPNSRSYRIPGELPSLPNANYQAVNPWLGPTMAVPDLSQADVYDNQAQQQSAVNKLDVLKSSDKLIGAARGSPEAAAEAGGVASDLGMPAFGRVVAGVRRAPVGPDLPGGAPALPGNEAQDSFAHRLAMYSAEEINQNPTLSIADAQKNVLSNIMKDEQAARVAAATERARMQEMYAAKNDPNTGEAALVGAKRRAWYDVEDQRAPQLIGLKRPEILATERGKEGVHTTGYSDRQDILTDAEGEREQEKADIAFDLAGDKAGVDLALHEGKKNVDLEKDPAKAAAVEKAKNPVLAERERDRSKIKLDQVDGELQKRLADFKSRLSATTDELVSRKKRLGNVEKQRDPKRMEETALKEAFGFLRNAETPVDPSTGQPMDRKAFVNKVVGMYLDVARSQSMDPTARAVLQRFGGQQ